MPQNTPLPRRPRTVGQSRVGLKLLAASSHLLSAIKMAHYSRHYKFAAERGVRLTGSVRSSSSWFQCHWFTVKAKCSRTSKFALYKFVFTAKCSDAGSGFSSSSGLVIFFPF